MIAQQNRSRGCRETCYVWCCHASSISLALLPSPSLVCALSLSPSLFRPWATTRAPTQCASWLQSSLLDFSFFLITLGLKLSDAKVYEPWIRALLGTASHYCEAVVHTPRTVPSSQFENFPSGLLGRRPALHRNLPARSDRHFSTFARGVVMEGENLD